MALTVTACTSSKGKTGSANSTSSPEPTASAFGVGAPPPCPAAAAVKTKVTPRPATKANFNPYLVRGARQVPGPNMTQVGPPPKPITVIVDAPPDADEGVAAALTSGKGRKSLIGPIPTGPPPSAQPIDDNGDAPEECVRQDQP